jgi:MYXO-CTERM domain-containing protein
VDLDVFQASVEFPADPFASPEPPSFVLAPGSAAVDRGTPLANVSDGFAGQAPDLGAIELGERDPGYGPGAGAAAGSGGNPGTGGTSTTGGASGEGGASGTGAGRGGSSTGGVVTGGSANGGNANSGNANDGGDSGSSPDSSNSASNDESGCGCRTSPRPHGSAVFSALVFFAAAAALRRIRAAREASRLA